MDLYMEFKCEPVVIIKPEPVYTEHGNDDAVNMGKIEKECKCGVVITSDNYASLDDSLIAKTVTQICKCVSFCTKKQNGNLLQNIKSESCNNQNEPLGCSISASSGPLFKEDDNENVERLIITPSHLKTESSDKIAVNKNWPNNIKTTVQNGCHDEFGDFSDFDDKDFEVEYHPVKLESEEETKIDYQTTLKMLMNGDKKTCENSTKKDRLRRDVVVCKKELKVVLKDFLVENQSKSKIVLKDLTIRLEDNLRQTESTNCKNRSTKNSATCNQTRKPKTRTKTRHHCPYCNRNFTRRDSFSVHLSRRHSKKNPDFLVEKLNKKCFMCDTCKFKSSSARSFKSHMLTHEASVSASKSWNENSLQVHSNGKPTYSCRFCNKALTTKGTLADHLLGQHGDKFDKSLKTLFSCTIKHCQFCDFRVVYQNKLNRHVQVQHSNDGPTYTCKFCIKTFRGKVSLVDHLLCQHGHKFEKSLKKLLSVTIRHCNLCDFRIHSKGMLIKHIQRKHSDDRPTYSCKFCNKTLNREASLADHLLVQHGEKFDKSLKTLFSCTIKHCQFCDFRVVYQNKLNQHIQVQHSNDRPTCRFCNKTWCSKISLVDHLLSQHGDKFEKSLKKLLSLDIIYCNLCDFRVHTKCRLIQHIQIKHTNDRTRYPCRFCNKPFLSKLSLADHLLYYHDNKFDKSLKTLFSWTIKQCKLCGFRAIKHTKFSRHMTKHDYSLAKPIFKCNNCDYETFHKYNLISHIRIKHSNDKPNPVSK